MTRGKRCSPTAPRQKPWQRVRVWQPVKDWAHKPRAPRVRRAPQAPVEVTDPALAAFLVQRGYFVRGVKDVVQSVPGPFGRERQQYLVWVFEDPRAFDCSPVQAAIREYHESWEGYEMVMRPQRPRARVPITDQTKLSLTPRGKAVCETLGLSKQRRDKHDQAHREPVRISDE